MNKNGCFRGACLVIRYYDHLSNANCIFFRQIFHSPKETEIATMLIWIIISITIVCEKAEGREEEHSIPLYSCPLNWSRLSGYRSSNGVFISKLLADGRARETQIEREKCSKMNLTFDWARLTIIAQCHMNQRRYRYFFIIDLKPFRSDDYWHFFSFPFQITLYHQDCIILTVFICFVNFLLTQSNYRMIICLKFSYSNIRIIMNNNIKKGSMCRRISISCTFQWMFDWYFKYCRKSNWNSCESLANAIAFHNVPEFL